MHHNRTDKEIVERITQKYKKLTLEERKALHQFFKEVNSKDYQLNKDKYEKIIFKKPAPTAREFLDPNEGWLTKEFVESIFDHVKQDFVDILDPSKYHRQVVEYGCTRQGKSYLARLLMFYTMVFMHHLRDPNQYFGVSPTTSLSIYILSFNFKKTHEVYLKHIYNLLRQSERCRQVKFQDRVILEQEKTGVDYMIYSKAALVGVITLASGLQLIPGNDEALSVIGGDVFQAYISEIAFFIENNGASEEKIFRLYSDVTERITATVGKNYLGFIYLDTSANNAESMIENYIIKELSKQEDVFYRSRTRWEARPELFPKWKETNETFKIILGNSSIPMRIVENDLQLKDIPADLIHEVPIDVYSDYDRNLLKSVKDISGIPTQSESKFIQKISVIKDMFDDSLPNIEGLIIADAAEVPENLIWNKINSQFFANIYKDYYQIKRAVKEPRWGGIDIAHSSKGDLYGIACIHKEWSNHLKQIMYIIDFAFPIGPGVTGINLDAIESLFIDLSYLGRLNIVKVNSDKFQGETIRQNLTRKGIPASTHSVDTDISSYQAVLTSLHNGALKSGKNIFLYNNLQCLQLTKDGKGKEKVDHPVGDTDNKYVGNFEKSRCGLNAKDVSDAVAQALAAAKEDEHHPVTSFEEENSRFSVHEKDLRMNISKAYKQLMPKYRL